MKSVEETKSKGIAGNIPVFCAFDKIVAVDELKPNPKNPNQHPEEQIELLAKVIEKQGWRAPVTVSTLSGLIVRGHGRYMAAKMLGCPVPVDYQNYATEAEEMADLLADNRIAELSEMDNKMLAEIFGSLELTGEDLDLTGYSENDVRDIFAGLEVQPEENESADDSEPGEEPDNFNYKEQYGVIVMCKDEAEQEKIYNRLASEGYECKVVAT